MERPWWYGDGMGWSLASGIGWVVRGKIGGLLGSFHVAVFHARGFLPPLGESTFSLFSSLSKLAWLAFCLKRKKKLNYLKKKGLIATLLDHIGFDTLDVKCRRWGHLTSLISTSTRHRVRVERKAIASSILAISLLPSGLGFRQQNGHKYVARFWC